MTVDLRYNFIIFSATILNINSNKRDEKYILILDRTKIKQKDKLITINFLCLDKNSNYFEHLKRLK